jgi:hypothetical protein
MKPFTSTVVVIPTQVAAMHGDHDPEMSPRRRATDPSPLIPHHLIISHPASAQTGLRETRCSRALSSYM